MSGLPPQHIPRSRLTGALAASSVGVVEAGGGYGKSTLAAELSAVRGIAAVVVPLDDRHGLAAALIGALCSALRRAGMLDAATMLAEADEPRAALDGLIAALDDEGVSEQLLVFDDAHHLSGESAALIAHLAQRWPQRQRLLIVGRHLSGDMRRVRRLPECVLLDSTDLAMTVDEITALAERSGLRLTPGEAGELLAITGGWAAAVVLALPLVARAPVAATKIAELRRRGRTLGEIVDEHLMQVPQPLRAPIARALQLPLITDAVVEAATGLSNLLDVAVRAGLPVTPLRDGTWLLPHPVSEALAAGHPLDAPTARGAAAEYLRLGEVDLGLQTLLAVGDGKAAAKAIAGLGPSQLEAVGLPALRGFVARLAPDALQEHPVALLHLARLCEPVAAVRERAAALERLRVLAGSTGSASLNRAVQAETARDLVRDDQTDRGEAMAQHVLEHATADEPETRVRALDVLGRVQAWGRDPRSLQRAERTLTEAIETCRRLGQHAWAAQVVLPLAHAVHFVRGEFDLALHRIDEVLGGLNERSVHRPVILTFRAEILTYCGRYEEASASLSAALQLAETLDDDRGTAYAHWQAARIASQTEDTAATMAELQAVESHRGDWFDHATGAEFLADAADLCDRVGLFTLSWAYAERAMERQRESDDVVGRSLAALTARSGDPAEAERMLTDAATVLHRLEPRERWHITLLRAFAALRRGDGHAGALAARAYEEAALLGHPELPLVHERVIAEALVELAAASGSAAAASQLRGSGLPATITLFGRFGVTRGGQSIAGLEGRPAQVVKVVATLGPSSLDVVCEALWQEAAEGGRQRIRNVLTRLREAAGDIVIREGALLRLADDAIVDADLFEQEAARAMALSFAEHRQGVAMARAALARYHGDLLPADAYADWTVPRRERLRGLALKLLDMLAAHEAVHGDANEAARLVERAIAADPDDETRYVVLAGIHRDRGATGRAVDVARRGEAAMRELGVRSSPALEEMARALQDSKSR